MKKIFAWILTTVLTLCLMVNGALAAPAPNPYESMTLEELIELRTTIEGEIMAKTGGKEVSVPMGVYVAGKDIPVGSYSVKPNGAGYYAAVNIYATIQDIEDTQKLIAIYGMNNDESIGKLTVEDGQAIVITYGGTIFKVYTGLGF